MSNIILIGMPGAGKSTVGVVLAKALGYGFIDTDLMIQAKAGKQLYQIIEQSGTAGFLELENQTVAALWAERCVIATGGSVVYGAEAMEQLKKYELDKVIHEVVDKKIPFLGICLGLQLLFEGSDESQGVEGLGVLGSCQVHKGR